MLLNFLEVVNNNNKICQIVNFTFLANNRVGLEKRKTCQKSNDVGEHEFESHTSSCWNTVNGSKEPMKILISISPKFESLNFV